MNYSNKTRTPPSINLPYKTTKRLCHHSQTYKTKDRKTHNMNQITPPKATQNPNKKKSSLLAQNQTPQLEKTKTHLRKQKSKGSRDLRKCKKSNDTIDAGKSHIDSRQNTWKATAVPPFEHRLQPSMHHQSRKPPPISLSLALPLRVDNDEREYESQQTPSFFSFDVSNSEVYGLKENSFGFEGIFHDRSSVSEVRKCRNYMRERVIFRI